MMSLLVSQWMIEVSKIGAMFIRMCIITTIVLSLQDEEVCRITTANTSFDPLLAIKQTSTETNELTNKYIKLKKKKKKNDSLAKHNEYLRTELDRKRKLNSNQQHDLSNLQKQVKKLQDLLRRKEVKKCDREARMSQSQNNLADARNNYQREINLLKPKMGA